jgi:hypothetical protein
MSKRRHDIMVRLDDREVAVLDEHRGSTPRATYMRRLLHEPPKEQEVASRAQAMAILTRLARDGNTQAACVHARELREVTSHAVATTTPSVPLRHDLRCRDERQIGARPPTGLRLFPVVAG